MNNKCPSLNLPIAGKTRNKVQISLPSSKPKAKAAIPSLCAYGSDSESSEEEEIELIKPKPTLPVNQEKPRSGLFNILPAPKSNTFITKQVSKATSSGGSSKNTSTTFKDASSLVPRTLKKKSNELGDFGQSKKLKPSYDTYTERPDPVIRRPGEDYEDPEPEFQKEEDEDEEDAGQNILPEEFGQTSFNDDAFRHLGVGRKNRNENIQFTDVKMNDIIGDNKKDLMKNLTSNYKPPSNRDFFGGGSKKKHQITYLAYVAKERDEELRNTWAQNAFNKKQSRERYGF